MVGASEWDSFQIFSLSSVYSSLFLPGHNDEVCKYLKHFILAVTQFYTFSFQSFSGSTMLKLEPHSSYDSLEKFQCESETLKLTSDISKRYKTDPIPPSNSTKYVCSSQNSQLQQQSGQHTKVPPIRPKHQKEQNKRNNEDVKQNDNNDHQPQTNKELEKQRQLSDWYYIKSSPTKSKHHHSSPPLLPPRPPTKRNTNISADGKSLSTVGCGGNSSSSSRRGGFLQTNRKLTEEHFSATSTNNNVVTLQDDKYETLLKTNIESLIIAENTRNCIEIERNNTNKTMITNVGGVTCKLPKNGSVEVNIVSGKANNFLLEPVQWPPPSQQEPQNKQYLSKGRFIRRQHIGGNGGGCVRDIGSGCSRHDGARSVQSCGSGVVDVLVADEKAQMARKQFNVKHKSNLNNVRFGGGEVSSSSFEHVNCSGFVSEMTTSEKPLKSTNNFDATSNDMGPGKYIWKPENDGHFAVSTYTFN